MDQARSAVTGPSGAFAAIAVGLLLCAAPTVAYAGSSSTTGAYCMQRVFEGPTGTLSQSNKLNCTAGDVRISRALSAINADTGESKCIAGTTFTLQATFETIVTAASRYDETYFFRIDGGPDARGVGASTENCSVTKLDNNGPGSNLDGDTCGDLNAGTYQFNVTIAGVKCEDTNGDHLLNLPNCTSWHSNQGTACALNDVFTSNPDTKSKCTCDDTFQIPIEVEAGSGNITKKVIGDALVTYQVKVSNTSTQRVLTLNALCDDVYGTLAGTGCPSVQNPPTISSNTCGLGGSGNPGTLPATIQPGASYTCTFDGPIGLNVTGGVTDTVSALVKDDLNADVDVGTASATVSVTTTP